MTTWPVALQLRDCAVLNEELHDSQSAAVARAFQWRITFAIPHVDLCATFNQRARHIHMSLPCRHMQRGRPVDACGGIDIGARTCQRSHN